MRKRWSLIISIAVCMLLFIILWQQNVSADYACYEDIADYEFCSQSDQCLPGSGDYYVKRVFDGGNWCWCKPYGGTKTSCVYVDWGGKCYDWASCTDSICSDCGDLEAVSERSCMTTP